MKRVDVALRLLCSLMLAILPMTVIADAADRRAALNYMLHCQGCHMNDGSGQPGYVPDLRGSIARFLHVPEGRAYLARVPGTAQSYLDDQERAAVLNWMVTQFDAEHVPARFSPYTATELAKYRRDPESRATAERARIIKLIAAADAAHADETPATRAEKED